MKRLSDSEMEIMFKLWECDKAVTRAYLETELEDKKWSRTTFNTYLSRMTDKGAISCSKIDGTSYYKSIYKKDEYLSLESKSFIGKLFNNSFKGFVANFSQTNELSADDIRELEDFIKEAKSKAEGK